MGALFYLSVVRHGPPADAGDNWLMMIAVMTVAMLAGWYSAREQQRVTRSNNAKDGN